MNGVVVASLGVKWGHLQIFECRSISSKVIHHWEYLKLSAIYSE